MSARYTADIPPERICITISYRPDCSRVPAFSGRKFFRLENSVEFDAAQIVPVSGAPVVKRAGPELVEGDGTRRKLDLVFGCELSHQPVNDATAQHDDIWPS